MRIFVDTNVLPLDGSIDALELTTLVTLAAEHGHRLVIPRMVLIEAEAQQRARAENAFGQLHQALLAARRFTALEQLFVPTAEDVASAFRRALCQKFEIAALPAGAAEEALRREAFGIPPACRKGGARDAAIWLTVRWEHTNSDEESGFVTNNRTDFSDPADVNALNPRLLQELADYARRFHYYSSTSALVAALATSTERDLDLEVIGRSPVVQEVVEQSMLTLGDDRWSYQIAGPIVLKSIERSRCFKLQSHVLAILRTVWEAQGIAADRQLTFATLTARFRATVPVQLWLRLGLDEQGEPLSAGVQSIGAPDIELEWDSSSTPASGSFISTSSVVGSGNLAYTPTAGIVYTNATFLPNIQTSPLALASPAPKRIWTPLDLTTDADV